MEKLKIEMVGFNNLSEYCPHGYSCRVGSFGCRQCLSFKGMKGGYVSCSFSEKTPESAENKPEGSSVPADTRPVWEYMTVHSKRPLQTGPLDHLGHFHFELASMTHSFLGGYDYVFKRQKLS